MDLTLLTLCYLLAMLIYTEVLSQKATTDSSYENMVELFTYSAILQYRLLRFVDY